MKLQSLMFFGALRPFQAQFHKVAYHDHHLRPASPQQKC